MRRDRLFRLVIASLAFSSLQLLTISSAHAAPDCRGANIIMCTGDRIDCLVEETLPPSRCL